VPPSANTADDRPRSARRPAKQRTYERRALYRTIVGRVVDDVLAAATAAAAVQRAKDWALRRTHTG